MSTARARLLDEGGFTLIELMIAMTLLAIVIGPITGSFILGLLETSATRDRLTDTSGSQAIAAYLVTDIQSSQSVDVTSTCKPASLAAGTVVFGLTWDANQDDAITATTSVSYIDLPEDGQHQLYRASCTSSGSDTTLLIPSLAAANGFAPSCDGGSCAAATPKVVTVAITLESDETQTSSSYGAFTFEVEAKRRVGS